MIALLFALALAPDAGWERARVLHEQAALEPPSAPQRRDLSALVADLSAAAPRAVLPADAAARAQALGLSLELEDGVLWLADPPGRSRGSGLLGLRLGPLDAELVIEAPHPSSDRGTGLLASELFAAGGVRALHIATVHRDAGPGADPAHSPTSAYQSVTDGLSRGLPAALFVQLHGYAESTSSAAAVLSPGRAFASPTRLAALRAELAELLSGEVLSGAEVPALGALGNAQGALLAGRDRFLHLELSPDSREALQGNEALRSGLLALLLRDAQGRVQ